MKDVYELIDIDALKGHPLNSNEMSQEYFGKLMGHIKRTGMYPPIIVRRAEVEGEYQVLDGHHRLKAIRKLGLTKAKCVIWSVSEKEGLILLSTLNRLSGNENVVKRSELLKQVKLRLGCDTWRLSELLPENFERAEKLLSLGEDRLKTREPRERVEIPVAVHFFLKKEDKKKLEDRLVDIGGKREEALMSLVN